MKQSSYRLDQMDRHPDHSYGDLLCSGEKTPAQAFQSMVQYELGYGGSATVVTETKIVVKTTVLSKIDHTVFEGTKEELEPLLQYLAIFYQLSSPDDAGKLFDQLEDSPLKEKLLRPLFLTTAAIMMLGGGRAHRAMVGFLAEQAADIAQLQHYRLSDLVALGQLVIGGQSRADVIANLGADAAA